MTSATHAEDLFIPTPSGRLWAQRHNSDRPANPSLFTIDYSPLLNGILEEQRKAQAEA